MFDRARFRTQARLAAWSNIEADSDLADFIRLPRVDT